MKKSEMELLKDIVFDHAGKDGEYSVYSEFDLDEHVKHYTNYLEVVISPEGEVKYAVPSHQEILIRIACEKKGLSREELMKSCPPAYYFDFVRWLSMETGYMVVWTGFYEIGVEPTRKQMNMLRRMKMKGAYNGRLTK